MVILILKYTFFCYYLLLLTYYLKLAKVNLYKILKNSPQIDQKYLLIHADEINDEK